MAITKSQKVLVFKCGQSPPIATGKKNDFKFLNFQFFQGQKVNFRKFQNSDRGLKFGQHMLLTKHLKTNFEFF